MNEKMIPHLPLIQGVINRMGNNSFLIKGWTVTLVAAIFALAASGKNQIFIVAALIPIIVFWILDSYYLKQEKLYRKLYEEVISESSRVSPFSMDVRKYEVKSIFLLMFTISTGPFYSLLFLMLIFAAAIANYDIILHTVKSLCLK